MTERVGWGLIGAGDIAAKRVAAALQEAPDSSLVAVARRRPELVEEFARRFGASRWYTDWTELLQDPEVDAVYVATPVDLHARITLAAAEAGKHVLCEKPMAMNVAECDRMIDACQRHGVLLGIAYYRHLYPVVQRIAELLAEGAIGRPVVAQLNAFERFDPPAGHPRAWLLDPGSSGGGPMFDFGCHRIEILLNLLGRAEETVGTLTNALFSRPVEDSGAAVLRFESGAIGMVTVSHAASEPQDTLQIFGSEGSIHVPLLNAGEMTLVRGDERVVERHPPHPNLHLPLVAQFVEAIRTGGAPAVDGGAGRAVNAALEALASTSVGSPRRSG